MKKIVLYSSNSKHRDKSSNCTVFPKWAEQWDEVAGRHKDVEITLVVQLSGRYFLDIQNGELVKEPKNIKLITLPMDAKLPEFLDAVAKQEPDMAVAMPGPVSGYDWNGLRDAAIAEGLRKLGIDTICYSADTALDCFDKARTHKVLKENGFRIPDALYLHHELFVTDKLGDVCTGNVYQEYILWEIENMDMPVVIKSTTGSSSMGIFIAKSYEEAREYLLSEKLTEDVIVEQFLDGEEYGAEVHGDRGNYYVSPPFRIFNTVPGQLNDPLGQTTLKYGPILDEELKVGEVMAELKRLAELMGFSGIMEVDLVLVKGEWYILEINNRWSGLTTLITASQGRLPYDVYVDEAVGAAGDYNDVSRLSYACQFKMPKVELEILEKIAAEQAIQSIIQYEVRIPGREIFWFNDTVIGGFATMQELLDGFDALQQKYPEQIPDFLTAALREKEG
ncbi:MAG: ATP-grasp domain-containing protein [Lachnospiraceae bacterium]|nr:ATP-grasp domain-containing protein [Lachnospiraceae bacterium]